MLPRRIRVRVGDLRSVIREEFTRQVLNEWYDVPSSFEDFVRDNKIAVKDIYAGVDRIAAAYEKSAMDNDLLKKVVSAGVAGSMRAVFDVMQKGVWGSK